MTNEGKRLTKYAAVGALIAIPLPFTMPLGALIGAALGARKNHQISGRYY